MSGHDAMRAAAVLIVDDEPDMRFVVRRRLQDHGGWNVVGEAGDGAEALATIRAVQPDVALLDVMMPVGGDEVMPSIIRVAPRCMVAVFSALPATAHRRRLLALGAFCYYQKNEIDRLPVALQADYERFQRALAGEDTIPLWMATG